MNAFTSSDHTSYPFATTNKQDFQNLLSVYLDATLHPLLKEEDFRQEGWRLGPENPRAAEMEDQGSPSSGEDIVFKGVVYNEMKGQMTDSNYLYWIRFKEHIFPALNNSGGDPEKIPDLTHEQLVHFSRTNYHPSNAKIFSYGDMPLTDHLKHVGSVLDGFQNRYVEQDVKKPRDLSAGPVSFTVPGPIDTFTGEDKQYKTSVSWLAGDTTDVVENFALGILSSLLLDGYGSPMYRALVESEIGSSFTPNTGLDNSGRISIFSVGVSGTSEKDVPVVQECVRKVFEEHLSNGFNDEKVQGILHQLELALRHKTANFGMGIMEKTLSSWFNGSNPMNELAWNEVVDEFKRRYAQGNYLQQLMQKYFMNDNHLVFTMVGTPTYNQEMESKEISRRDAKLADLSAKAGSLETAIAQLKREELDLLKIQEAARHADLSCLPSLSVKDISRQQEWKSVRESKVDDIDVVWREAPTNGLTYFQAMNPFDNLPDELRLLLPLFNDCIMRLGTSGRSMEQWEDLMKLKTGGISSSTFNVSSPLDIDKFSEGLQFSGYAIDKSVPAMLEMITALVTETNFTGSGAPKMIQELLRSMTNGVLDSVAASGHRYAVNVASSNLARKFWAQQQQSGLAQVQAMAQLLQDAETSPDKLQELIQKLVLIQSFAISKLPKLRVRMVCEPESSGTNEANLQRWLSSLPPTKAPSTLNSSFEPTRLSSKVMYDLPFQVSYSGVALQTTPFTDPASATLSVLSKLLTHNHLHTEIREKGGAYGAAAGSGPVQSLFTMSSYRDPSPANSLKVFESSGLVARDRTWTDRELEEAKLGIFQGLDAPVSVDEEGQRYFMSGVTQEMDQRWREQVLDVTAKDVNEVAHKFLVEGTRKATCVLGDKKGWSDLQGWDVRAFSTPAEDDALTSAEAVSVA
jgi:Zn-dependent M16 (insulinase) family peptidase